MVRITKLQRLNLSLCYHCSANKKINSLLAQFEAGKQTGLNHGQLLAFIKTFCTFKDK